MIYHSTLFRFYLVLGLVLAGAFSLSAQNSPSFTAYADAKEVVLGSYFEVTFTLKNADGSNFTPPNLSEFIVLSGPSQSFQTTIVNGRMSKELSYSYQLQPRRTGRISIGAASMKVNGRTLQTQALSVNVVESSAAASDSSTEVYLVARLNTGAGSDTDVYLGQQLVVDYVLYTRVDVEGLTASEELTYDGFFMREVHQFDTRMIREVVNGVQYVSRILKRVVLYPQRSGTLNIEPLTIVAGVPVPGQRSSGFFTRKNLRRVPITSKAMELEVLPLPLPKPTNFSDITGNFTLQGTLLRNTITTDDALSLILTFEGQGDLKRVQAPDLGLSADDFESYDPKVLEEEYIDLSAGSKGRKKFEYLLVPKKAGQFTLRPQVVVFNTDSASYQTLTTIPLQVDIRPGTGEKKSGLIAGAKESQGLYPPRQTISLNTKGKDFFGTPLYWGLFLLPILVTSGALVYKNIQKNKPAVDPIWLKQQQARQAALTRLQTAEKHRQATDPRAFYDEVERALLGYVSDKRQIDRADLTKANVLTQLQALGASDQQREQFMTLIRTCEMALYAGMNNADAMEATYTQAVQLLSDMASAD